MDKDKPLNTHINMLKSLTFDEGQQDPDTDYLNAINNVSISSSKSS